MVSFLEYMYHDVKFCYQVDICNCLIFINHNLFWITSFRHVEGRKCPYSNVPDMYNMCQYAHSEEELDEWRERYEWRQMKREMARQEKVFSFMDELLEQYQSAEHGIKVVSVL